MVGTGGPPPWASSPFPFETWCRFSAFSKTWSSGHANTGRVPFGVQVVGVCEGNLSVVEYDARGDHAIAPSESASSSACCPSDRSIDRRLQQIDVRYIYLHLNRGNLPEADGKNTHM